MQNRFEDKLSMFEKVDTFFQTNLTDLSVSVPILATAYTDFRTKLDAILASAQASSEDTTGYTIDKANKRKALEQLAIKISRALTAYSSVANNVTLRAKINFNKSDLEKMRDNDIYTNANLIEDYATQFSSNLTPYGISATDISDLSLRLKDFFEIIQTPKIKIEIRSSYFQQLETQIAEEDKHLKEVIDPLMGVLEFDEPLLFTQYKKARSIDQTGSQSSSTVYNGTVSGNGTANIATLVYDIDRTFTFKNTGTTPLFYGLSDDGSTIAGVEIAVNPNEEITRDSPDMNDSGNILLVRNAGVVDGNYWVSVDK